MTLTIFGLQVTITRVTDLASSEDEIMRAMEYQAIEYEMARVRQIGLAYKELHGWSNFL